MSKPNTMDDWIDEVLEASPTDKEVPEGIWNDIHPTWTGLWTDSWGEWDEILAGNLFPIKDLIGDERAEWLKVAITAKLKEVDRAAREWELNWITGLNPKHPDFTKIVKDRLAELRKANSLKGGDV